MRRKAWKGPKKHQREFWNRKENVGGEPKKCFLTHGEMASSLKIYNLGQDLKKQQKQIFQLYRFLGCIVKVSCFAFFIVLICKCLSVINSNTLTCENIVLLSSLFLYSIHILIRTMCYVEKYYYKIHTHRISPIFSWSRLLRKKETQ